MARMCDISVRVPLEFIWL